MTFGVTYENRSNNGSRLNLVIFDTEQEARESAESLVKKSDIFDITVWKQIAVPKLETSVSWDDEFIPDGENPENETGFSSFNDTM